MDTRDASRSIELLRTTPIRRGGGSPARAEAPAGPPLNPRVLVRGVLRHWWQILTLWVIGSAAAAGFIYLKFKPSYEAMSLLRVDPVGADPFSTVVSHDPTFLETQVQLITSTNVLLAASKDPEVAGFPIIRLSPDVVTAIRLELIVGIVPGSNLIRISMSSSSSEEAAGVVNAVVDAYLKADSDWSESINEDQIKRLTEFHEQLKEQVETKQKEWMSLAANGNFEPAGGLVTEATGTLGGQAQTQARTPASRLSVTIDEYRKIREQLVGVNIDLVEAEAHLEARRRDQAVRERGRSVSASASPGGIGSSIEWQLRQDGDLAALRAQIDEAGRQVAAASRLARHPRNEVSVKRFRANQQALVERYNRLHAEKLEQLRRLAAQPAAQPGPANVAAPVDRTLEEAAARVDTLRATKARLESMLAQLDVINRQQGTDAVKIAFLQADLQQLRSMQAVVDRRLEALHYESRGRSQILKIDEAMPTKAPISDKRPKLLAMAPLGVLFSVLGLFTLLEIRSRRVDCPDDLSRRVQTEVYAIPPLPRPQPVAGVGRLNRRPPPDPGEQLEEFAHRIDHLRVALCGDAADPGWGRCVMITSAVGGEGKTTLAAQLAARCADAGLATLLIDADLRRASLGRVFDLAESAGLSEVLRGEAALESVLVDLPQVSGCKLLAAGGPVTNPGRVLEGPRLRETVERLRRSFDVILIDTPPILPVPDALILGRWADGVLLATRHDESRLPLLERARRLLDNAGLPLLGVAINGVRPSGMHYPSYAYQYQSSHRRTPAKDV